jgi:hypothetical protein
MNQQLDYLNKLVMGGVITQEDYANRLYLVYQNEPTAFNQKDTDYVERVMKASDIPFNRDMEAAEQSMGSVLNQFVSGFAEGFTTFGWADDADTTTESIANKMGHLVGLAPDVIAGVLTMGASIPSAVAKVGLRSGVKRESLKGTLKARTALKEAASGYSAQTQKLASKLKVGNFDLIKESKNPITGEKQMFLRSVPMRISDWVIDNAQKSLDKNGLLSSGFLSKGLLGNEQFRKIAHDGIHLGIALGVSARKEGPGGMVEAAVHGTMAGAVFGGIAEVTSIGRLLGNPNTKKLGEEAIRKMIVKPKEQEDVINLFARGVLGSAYTGGMATMNEMPLPEQVYEYALGFFFGASGRSLAENKATQYLSTNPIPGNANLAKAKENLVKTKEYKELPKESKEYIERHFTELNIQQVDRIQGAFDLMGVEYVKKAQEEKVDLSNITPEQHARISELVKEDFKFANLQKKEVEVKLSSFKERIQKEIADKEIIKKENKDEANQPMLDSFDTIIAEIKKFDLNEAVIKDSITKKLYNEMLDKYPEFQFEDLAKTLTDSIDRNLNNYDGFIKDFKQVYPEVVIPKGFKQYFMKKVTYRLGNNIMLDANDVFQRIGIDRHADAKGNLITVKEAANKINKMYGDERVRQVLRYREKEVVDKEKDVEIDKITGEEITPMKKELVEPFAAEGVSFFMEMNTKLKENSNDYIHSANKDTGMIIIQKLPFEKGYDVTTFNKTLDRVIKKYSKESSKIDKSEYTEVAANAIYELLDNGLITQKDLSNFSKVETALDTYLNPKNNYPSSAAKINKYQPLSQGIDIPVQTKDVIEFLDVEPSGKFTYSKTEGFEVSTRGDNFGKQFSALNARLKDGRTIEEAYQQAKGTGKGQPAKDPNFDYYGTYKSLWQQWSKENPGKIKELKNYLDKNNITTLRDRFATTENRQDRALSEILNEFSREGEQLSLFEKVEKEGFFKVSTYIDPPRFNKKGEKSALDGVIYVRQDVFDKIRKVYDMESFSFFMKPVGHSKARDGVGHVKLKAGLFRADNAMNDYLVGRNEHMVMYDSSAKQRGGIQSGTLVYNTKTGKYESNGVETVFKMRPEEIGINPDVKEKNKTTNLKMYKQMMDKNSSLEIDSNGKPIFDSKYFESLNGLREKNMDGDSVVTEKYLNNRENFNEKDLVDIDIDAVNVVDAIKQGRDNLDTALGRWTIKQIFRRYQSEDFALAESYVLADIAEITKTNNFILNAERSDYSLSYLMRQGNKELLDRVLGNYAVYRALKINVETGFQSVAFPFSQKMMAEGGIKTNEFKRGEGAKDDPIIIEGREGTTRLEDAYNEFKKMSPAAEGYKELKDALTFAIMRSPNASNGGIRILQFAGFEKDGGSLGYYSNEYNDMMKGGMDKDGDKVVGYQSIPARMKEAFGKKEIQRELELEDGTIMKLKDEDGSLDIAKRYFGAEQAVSDISQMFSTKARLEIGKASYDGKSNMGQVINGTTQLQILMQMADANGGKLELGNGAILNLKSDNPGFKRLKQISIVGSNIHADSSGYKNLLVPRDSLTRIFNDFFEYTNPVIKEMKNGIEILRKDGTMKLGESLEYLEKSQSPFDDLSYYTIFGEKYGAPGLQAFRAFSRMLNEKADLSRLIDVSRNFLDYFDVNNEGTSVQNYYVQMARNLSKFEEFDMNSFSYNNYSNVNNLIGMMEAAQLAIKDSPIVKNLKLIDYYSVRLSQKEKDILAADPTKLEQSLNEVIGITLMAKQGEKVLEILNQIPALQGRKGIDVLKEITNRAYELKINNRQSYLLLNKMGTNTKNNGEQINPINVDKFITAQKEGFVRYIESLGMKGTRLKEDVRRELEMFYDFSILGNAVPEKGQDIRIKVSTGGVTSLNSELSRLKSVTKEIQDTYIKYGDSPKLQQLYGIRKGILNDVQARADQMWQSAALNKSSIRRFSYELDSFIFKSKERKQEISTKEEPAVKEIEKETELPTLSEEIQVKKSDYGKIKEFNIEEALKKRANDPNLTEEAVLTMLDFHNLLESRPGVKDYIEPLYESFQGGVMTGKPFNEITIKELQSLMSYINAVTTPGWLKTFLYDPKVRRSPQGRDHILSKGYTEEYLAGATQFEKDSTFKRVDNIVKDKFGNITFKSGKVPTTTLGYGNEIQYMFHQVQNTFNRWTKDVLLKENFDWATLDNGNLMGTNFDLLFSGMLFRREYQDGNSPIFQRKSPRAQKNIKQLWLAKKRLIDKMVNDGTTFIIKDLESTKGTTKEVGAYEVMDLMNKKYTEIMTKAMNDIIVSKAPKIRAKLKEAGFKVDQYKIPKNEDIDLNVAEKNTANIIKSEINELKRLLFDKNGILSDIKKIDALFKGILDMGPGSVDQVLKQTFSEADARFIEHNLLVKDMLKEHFPDVNFNKELSKKEFEKARTTYNGKPESIKTVLERFNKIHRVDTRIGLGRFMNEKTGEVDSYVPHIGGFDFKSLRDKNRQHIKDKINEKLMEIIGKKGDKMISENLPSQIRIEFEAGNIKKDVAISLTRQYFRELFDKEAVTGVDLELSMGEESNIRLLNTRPELQADNSNRNISKSRSVEELPAWDTSFNSTERYLQSSYSSWLRHVQNIKLKLIADQFIEKNPFGTDKEGMQLNKQWHAYILDVFSNNNGFPSLRNFNIHGIKEGEARLIKSYIDSGLDREKLKEKQYISNSDLRFLNLVDTNFGLTKTQQAQINMQKNAATKRDLIKKFRTNNLQEILKPENINKIGRFNTAYDVFSDEAVVGFLERVNDTFGGNILKDAPKGGTARRYWLVRKAKAWSEFEGKFEMVSLLSHPKSALTNFYGGFSNTIVDEGWSSFRQANNEQWLLNNVFPKGKDGRGPSYFTIDAQGNRKKVHIESYNDIINWLFREGFLEDGLVTEGYYSQKKAKVDRGRIKDLIVKKILDGKDSKGNNYLNMSDKEAAALRSRTMKEAINELGVIEGLTDAGSFFMRKSEMVLRTRTALASIINTRNILGKDIIKDMAFNDPIVLNIARQSVKASQFVYHATQRPNFSNTNLGRIMTRFHPYAWNSIGRRIDIYSDGINQKTWNNEVKKKRANNQFTADVFALAMANIFASSIFEYALSPPMSWMQDTAQLIFGDEEMRDRAFFSQYPHPVLAPLAIVTPPVSRFILPPLTAFINGNYDTFWNYQFHTYFPFGRLGKDMVRTIKSPAMAPDFLTGVPLHKVHSYARDYFNSEELEDILAELREKNREKELK